MEKFENYKILIYLLIGLLYFIFKNRNKKVPSSNHIPAKENIPETLPKRGALLKKGKEMATKMESTSRPEKSDFLEERGMVESSKPLDYDEMIKDEEGKIIVPVMSDSDRESKEKFEPYSGKGPGDNEFGKLLKNPDSVKKALILNEILTPKHF